MVKKSGESPQSQEVTAAFRQQTLQRKRLLSLRRPARMQECGIGVRPLLDAASAEAGQHGNGITCARERAEFLFEVSGRRHKCSLCKKLGAALTRLLLSRAYMRQRHISGGRTVTPCCRFAIDRETSEPHRPAVRDDDPRIVTREANPWRSDGTR